MESGSRQILRWEDWFLERLARSFAEPPRETTLDIEVFDDPTHGQQQLTFYQGFLLLLVLLLVLLTRPAAATNQEIRNPKFEISNKFEIPRLKPSLPTKPQSCATSRFPPPGMLWKVPSSVLARFCH